MDGRIQLPVAEYIKSKYAVDYVDTVTEAGVNKLLADNSPDILVESVRRHAQISVDAHGSKHIAVIGHHDCAGNPVDDETQKTHIKSAVKTVKSWGLRADVVGLWVNKSWQVEDV